MKIAKSLAKNIDASMNVVYFPQLGYLVSLENIPGIRDMLEQTDDYGNQGDFTFVVSPTLALLFLFTKLMFSLKQLHTFSLNAPTLDCSM